MIDMKATFRANLVSGDIELVLSADPPMLSKTSLAENERHAEQLALLTALSRLEPKINFVKTDTEELVIRFEEPDLNVDEAAS